VEDQIFGRHSRESAEPSGRNFAAKEELPTFLNFVLAELNLAIHAFVRPKRRRGCAQQVRARRV
jgi:hypothetical protein